MDVSTINVLEEATKGPNIANMLENKAITKLQSVFKANAVKNRKKLIKPLKRIMNVSTINVLEEATKGPNIADIIKNSSQMKIAKAFKKYLNKKKTKGESQELSNAGSKLKSAYRRRKLNYQFKDFMEVLYDERIKAAEKAEKDAHNYAFNKLKFTFKNATLNRRYRDYLTILHEEEKKLPAIAIEKELRELLAKPETIEERKIRKQKEREEKAARDRAEALLAIAKAEEERKRAELEAIKREEQRKKAELEAEIKKQEMIKLAAIKAEEERKKAAAAAIKAEEERKKAAIIAAKKEEERKKAAAEAATKKEEERKKAAKIAAEKAKKEEEEKEMKEMKEKAAASAKEYVAAKMVEMKKEAEEKTRKKAEEKRRLDESLAKLAADVEKTAELAKKAEELKKLQNPPAPVRRMPPLPNTSLNKKDFEKMSLEDVKDLFNALKAYLHANAISNISKETYNNPNNPYKKEELVFPPEKNKSSDNYRNAFNAYQRAENYLISKT